MNAIERIAHRMFNVILFICVIISLFYLPETTVNSRLVVSITVELGIIKDGCRPRVDEFSKKLAYVLKNITFD